MQLTELIIALALIAATYKYSEPLYAVAAGLFYLAGNLRLVLRPIRLKRPSNLPATKEVRTNEHANRNR